MKLLTQFCFQYYRSARNDVIESIKYTPRVRKTKPKKEFASTEEEDIKPEELALNKNIIALVKQHDVLYDRKRVRDSKNLAAKNEAWSIIASTLDVSGIFYVIYFFKYYLNFMFLCCYL